MFPPFLIRKLSQEVVRLCSEVHLVKCNKWTPFATSASHLGTGCSTIDHKDQLLLEANGQCEPLLLAAQRLLLLLHTDPWQPPGQHHHHLRGGREDGAWGQRHLTCHWWHPRQRCLACRIVFCSKVRGFSWWCSTIYNSLIGSEPSAQLTSFAPWSPPICSSVSSSFPPRYPFHFHFHFHFRRWSWWFAEVFGQVYSFKPHSTNYDNVNGILIYVSIRQLGSWVVTGLWGWETSLASCARAILSFFTPSRCVSSSQSSHCFLVFLYNPPGRDCTEFDVCHVEPGDSTLLRKQDRKNNSETSKSFF